MSLINIILRDSVQKHSKLYTVSSCTRKPAKVSLVMVFHTDKLSTRLVPFFFTELLNHELISISTVFPRRQLGSERQAAPCHCRRFSNAADPPFGAHTHGLLQRHLDHCPPGAMCRRPSSTRLSPTSIRVDLAEKNHKSLTAGTRHWKTHKVD